VTPSDRPTTQERRRPRAVLLAAAVAGAVGLAAGAWAVTAGNTAPPASSIAACITTNLDTAVTCTEQAAPVLLAAHGLPAVLEAFTTAIADAGTSGAVACHPIGETIGAAWARATGTSALADLTYSCLGGPMHGVFYTLGQQTPAAELANASIGLCEQQTKDLPWVAGWDCRHGVGHALGLDPATSATDAFQLCTQVYPNPDDAGDCGTGVMGSLIDRVSHQQPTPGYDPRQAASWCRDNLAGALQTACATRAGIIAHLTGTPLTGIAEACPVGDATCAYAAGYAAGIPTFNRTPAERVAPCRSWDDSDPRNMGMGEACIAGLMRNLTPDYHLLGIDPGVCAVAGNLEAACRAETTRMQARELTLTQVVAVARGQQPPGLPAATGPDPAAWPSS
jgi:hypothetical protein